MLAIGLMSGTSMDGIDCSLIETNGQKNFEVIGNLHIPYSTDFVEILKSIMDEKYNWLFVEKELTILHAECVNQLLRKLEISADKVSTIGFHGQTIYHNPSQGITWQIGNPHLLSRLTGINVVSDFRRRDVANGGQGAPLVPIFHQAIMSNEALPVAVLNIGGVANLTYIGQGNKLIAFDTGPGNALINDAMLKFYNMPFDDKGLVASKGKANSAVVNRLLENEFFSQKPPKSLDRNNFDYKEDLSGINPEDVIATLTQFTVASIIKGIKLLPSLPQKLYVCGGGAKNETMLDWLKEGLLRNFNKLHQTDVLNIKHKGMDSDFIESQAFAYLAVRYLENLPSTFSDTTGVNRGTLSGVLYRL